GPTGTAPRGRPPVGPDVRPASGHRPSLLGMCRNITTLRGLDPPPTDEEIQAAARQYVRKVSGVQSTSALTEEAFERAVGQVADATSRLLDELPARRQPPPSLPPLRRRATATG
ncbi:MAG TPA: DUF2277 domain-containing protein, partial [Acidimicrobiales bacterium]|nr:DUF2277 domain-containing protein [Acidimicrobiales bacterium]